VKDVRDGVHPGGGGHPVVDEAATSIAQMAAIRRGRVGGATDRGRGYDRPIVDALLLALARVETIMRIRRERSVPFPISVMD